VTPIDAAYRRAQAGDHGGFAEWIRHVEHRLRASLRSFALGVDVEAIVQEGLLRMWVLAPTLDLEGEDASLRYAGRLVRNLANREAKRVSTLAPLEGPDGTLEHDVAVPPVPSSDPGLRRAILECMERLPAKPALALEARLAGRGIEPDRDLAARVRMTLNTFLQNVVRARKHLAKCLGSKGVAVEEWS